MTDKIKTILEQMTIEEKADMVCGASNFCTADASRYGVPAIRMLDGSFPGVQIRAMRKKHG